MKRLGVWLATLAVVLLMAPATGLVRESVVSKEIHFDLDRAVIRRDAVPVLEEVAAILKANPQTIANLVGHTCDLAMDDYNENLAKRRVRATATYLERRLGVPVAQLDLNSYGEHQPKYDNNDAAQKALNRRVEIRLITRVDVPAPTVRLDADPASVTRGQASILSWSSTNATSVDIQPGVGRVGVSGTTSIRPDRSTTYVATAVGEGGTATDPAEVGVTAPPAPPENIRSVHTSVVDASGNFLIDLPAANFTVTENGERREIVSVTYEAQSAPSAISLVLDKSGSMASAIRKLKEAAIAFVTAKKDNDRVQVMGFSSDIRVLSDFETDRNRLERAIRSIAAGGTTHLYDVLFEASTRLAAVEQPRLMLLMTDGVDEGGFFGAQGSSNSLDAAIAKARESGVTVYTIGLGDKLDRSILERIANETGGHAYFTTDPAELSAIYQRLAGGLLRGRYRIDYRTPSENPTGIVVGSQTGRITRN